MRRKPNIRDIIAAVSVVTGVDFGEMTGGSRDPSIVEARRLVALVAKRRLRASFPNIAEAMGKPQQRRGHSAVIGQYNAAMRLDDANERCNPFARKVDAVNDLLSESEFHEAVRREGESIPAAPKPVGHIEQAATEPERRTA